MNSFEHRYELPVVPQNLPPQETLFHIFDSLRHLENVVDDVFSRLTHRVNHEKTKIQNVSDRIALAQRNTRTVSTNQSKATIVHSLPRHPAPKRVPDFERINCWEPNNPLRVAKLSDFKISPAEKEKRMDPVDTTDLFYSLSSSSRYLSFTHEAGEQQGLGRLPENIRSIDSLLLFNTPINPYEKYCSLDVLEGIEGTDRLEKREELSDAPPSLGDTLPHLQKEQIGFQPKLSSAPVLELPAHLPLRGIANINYSVGNDSLSMSSIAPSKVKISELPDVQFFPHLTIDKRTQQRDLLSVSAVVQTPPPPPRPSPQRSNESAAPSILHEALPPSPVTNRDVAFLDAARQVVPQHTEQSSHNLSVPHPVDILPQIAQHSSQNVRHAPREEKHLYQATREEKYPLDPVASRPADEMNEPLHTLRPDAEIENISGHEALLRAIQQGAPLRRVESSNHPRRERDGAAPIRPPNNNAMSQLMSRVEQIRVAISGEDGEAESDSDSEDWE